MARYNKDATLDQGFGKGGEVLVEFGSDPSATAAGLAIQTNGQIVVAGTASGFDSDDNFFQDFALGCLTASGRRDASFASGGEVLTGLGPDMQLTTASLEFQPNGKIVVAGRPPIPTRSKMTSFCALQHKWQPGHEIRYGRPGDLELWPRRLSQCRRCGHRARRTDRGGGGDGGGGGGGNPANPLLGTWSVTSTPAFGNGFPATVTFKANGQFTWVQFDVTTGVTFMAQGSYTLAPIETGGFPFVTMISQGQIFIQGLFAQPGPGEFFVQTTALIFAFIRD